MTDRPWCEERVFGHNCPVGGSQCSNRAKAEYNGKWLCGTHSPEAEARRQQKSDEHEKAYAASWKRKQEQYDRASACTAAFHDPQGRSIPTESIEPGLFWRLVTSLGELTWATSGKEQIEKNKQARALLNSFQIEESDGAAK